MANDGNASDLNDKQERFCREYVIDNHGTNAAIRAGYSEKTANEQASRLLANVNILNRINELNSEVEKTLLFQARDVLTEVGNLAFSNIQDYIEENNIVKDISTIDRDKAAAIQSIKTTETFSGRGEEKERHVTTEIKLYDKVKSNELLGKYFKLWIEQVQHSGDVELVVTRKIINSKADIEAIQNQG